MVFQELVNGVIEVIKSTGAWGVILGVLIESVLAPIPSPLIIMAAGFIMLPASLSLFEVINPLLLLIVLPGAFASTIGSYIGYSIGYYGGKPLIKKFEWLLGVSWDELEAGVKRFGKGKRDELIVFSARALPIIPLSVFSAVAGVMRLKFKMFTLYTFLGALVRVFILGLLGWLMGSLYEGVASRIELLENIGLVFLLAVVVFIFFMLYKKHKKSKKKKTKAKK